MSWLHADSATLDQEPTLAERARAIQTRQPIPGFYVRAQGDLSQLYLLHADELCLLAQACLIPIRRLPARLGELPVLCYLT